MFLWEIKLDEKNIEARDYLLFSSSLIFLFVHITLTKTDKVNI